MTGMDGLCIGAEVSGGASGMTNADCPFYGEGQY